MWVRSTKKCYIFFLANTPPPIPRHDFDRGNKWLVLPCYLHYGHCIHFALILMTFALMCFPAMRYSVFISTTIHRLFITPLHQRSSFLTFESRWQAGEIFGYDMFPVLCEKGSYFIIIFPSNEYRLVVVDNKWLCVFYDTTKKIFGCWCISYLEKLHFFVH